MQYLIGRTLSHYRILEKIGEGGMAGNSKLRTQNSKLAASTVTFLVMELVEGVDLADRIKRGAIPVDEALPIALQIATAPETAHESGIVHRDLASNAGRGSGLRPRGG